MLGAGAVLQVLEIDFDLLRNMQGFIDTMLHWQLISVVVLCILLFTLQFTLLYGLWRNQTHSFKVYGANSENIYVSRKSVNSLAQNLLDNYEGVVSSRCYASSSREGVVVNARIRVLHGTGIPELVNSIQDSMKEELEQRLGIKMDRIIANIHYDKRSQ